MLIKFGLHKLKPPLSFRRENGTDSVFLEKLFFACNRQQFASIAPPGMLNVILKQQFNAQSIGYKSQFPSADGYVILFHKLPIGRLMLNLNENTLLLVDIAITPSSQQKGLGTQIMCALIRYATSEKLELELSVSINNATALAFYIKLGFKVICHNGHHTRMQYFGS